MVLDDKSQKHEGPDLGRGPAGNNAAPASNPPKFDDTTGLIWVSWYFTQAMQDLEKYPIFNATYVFFNVMNFKAINNRFGYEGGNEYLRYFADETKKIFEDEVVARAGADHLVIISYNLSNEIIIERLKVLSKIMRSYEKGLRSHIKAGIYNGDGTQTNPVILMDHASIACNEVRSIYNKDFAIYDEELKKRHELKQYVLEHFEDAFKEGYFKVYYQPVVRALTKKVCGYEALARWIDPVRGMISPLIFIEVLEKVHLIHKLDAYVIEQACKDLRDDIDSGFAYQPISVNLSRLDFELSDIRKVVDNAVAKYNVPKEYIVLEVTESAFAADQENLGDVIRNFREDGYQVWIDDFGSGYSSFNNLQTYDFDFLKIDMNFLRNFDKTPKSKVIIASIVDMAKKLGIHTLAEGVETEEQYEFLKSIGCELIQGYYFSKPLPIEDYHTRRAELCNFETNETPEERSYYDEIGRINFLDNTPLRLKKMDVASDIPVAIIEREDRHYRAIFANNAFIKEIHSFGAKDVPDVIKLLWKQHTPQDVQKYYENILHAEEHKETVEYNMMLNFYKVNTRVRFIARMGKKSVYAFMTKNLTLHESL